MAMDSDRRSINSGSPASESPSSDALVASKITAKAEEKNAEKSIEEYPSLHQPLHQRQLAWQIAPNVFLSFRYAWMGVVYAFATQRNLRIHTIIGTIALAMSAWLQLSLLEIAVISLTIALVLAMELLNTAIESVVDLLVKQSYHELAKIAKDCAAGAVLVSALASVLVAGLLLLPPLYQKIVDWSFPLS